MIRAVRSFLSDDLTKLLLSGGAWAAIIKIASAAAAYAMLVVLARLMSPEEFGRFAFGLSLALTLSLVFSFGLPVASLRFWQQHRVKNQPALARSFIAHGAYAVTLGAAACAILFFVIASTVTGGDASYGTEYWFVLALLIGLMAVSEFVQSSLRADGVIIRSLAPRDVGWRLLVIAISLIVAGMTLSFSAESALWIAVACLLAITLPQLLFAKRRLGIRRGDFRAQTEWPTWIRSTWPMWGSAILIGLIQQFDVVLLGLFLGPEQTGPYFAALRTASLMTLLLFASNMVAAPLISKYFHSADRDRLIRMSRILVIGITVPTILGFLALVLFGDWLLSVFDPAFADAYGLLIVLSAGFALTALGGPVNYFLQMVGYEKHNLKIQAGIYAAVVTLQCVLVPTIGAMGAAIPNAVGAAVATVWAVLLLRKRIGIDPSVLSLVLPVRDKSALTDIGSLPGPRLGTVPVSPRIDV